MQKDTLNDFINEIIEMEAKEAKEAGAIGYTARSMIQATLPHSKIEDFFFQRTNGNFRLSMTANPEIGLPYGSIPRLILAWMATEAVRTKEPMLILGNTLSSFMEKLELVPKGGRWGTIARLKDQIQKLFSCSISCIYDDGKRWAINNIKPVHKAYLWWETDSEIPSSVVSTQGKMSTNIINSEYTFKSTVILTQEFFSEIVNGPVPIDMRALKILKRSPLALDMYFWLTYRFSYLKKPTIIPWQVLLMQFGSKYPQTSRGVRNFKMAFIRELKKVHLVFPAMNVDPSDKGLILNPGKPHIPKPINHK